MGLSENIRRLREQHRLTQEKLGQELGLSRNQINSYERGSARPSLEKCIELAEYFNIGIKDLVRR